MAFLPLKVIFGAFGNTVHFNLCAVGCERCVLLTLDNSAQLVL